MDNPIIEKIKYDTNNISDMMYRKIYKDKHTIYIIYNEPLTSGNDISDFIVRSIDNINGRERKREFFEKYGSLFSYENLRTDISIIESQTYGFKFFNFLWSVNTADGKIIIKDTNFPYILGIKYNCFITNRRLCSIKSFKKNFAVWNFNF